MTIRWQKWQVLWAKSQDWLPFQNRRRVRVMAHRGEMSRRNWMHFDVFFSSLRTQFCFQIFLFLYILTCLINMQVLDSIFYLHDFLLSITEFLVFYWGFWNVSESKKVFFKKWYLMSLVSYLIFQTSQNPSKKQDTLYMVCQIGIFFQKFNKCSASLLGIP